MILECQKEKKKNFLNYTKKFGSLGCAFFFHWGGSALFPVTFMTF